MFKLYDICLIGLGPAGVGFLSSLDEKLLKNSICFEKGSLNTACTCHTNHKCSNCEPCSIISGLGGASRFSCGKISNFPAGSGLLHFWNLHENTLVDFMNLNLEDLKKDLGLCKIDVSDEKRTSTEMLFKASGITYKYYDVYEFKKEQYISYLTQIVDDAQAKGLYIKYNTNVEQIKKENLNNETVFSIITNGKDGISIYFAKKVVLATGNIDDSTKLIQDLINKEPKIFFEIGIRVIVPTDKISSILDSHGDLKLKYKDGRTYCVSKNGFIIAYSVNDALFLEGYIDNTKTSNLTNFAVIIKCDDQNMLKKFKENYIKKYHGIPIRQGYNDYINNKISVIDSSEKYIPIQQGNINDLFSDEINSRIIEFIEDVLIGSIGLNRDDIVVYAPELKESDCFEINTDFQVTNNVFVIGAATGKFRGILQSLCSGKHCADIVRR